MGKLKRCRSIGYVGIPQLRYRSKDKSWIVMEKVGPTLLSLFTAQQSFTLKTVLMIGLQAISALEELHEFGVVHKDVKPDNIAVGRDTHAQLLYLIDMGLSTEVLHNKIHVQYAEGVKFQGTPFFASENVISGVKPARRDDLESLGYALLFLHTGTLPWLHVPFTNHSDLPTMLAVRQHTSLHDLCSSAHPVLYQYLSYCKHLDFQAKPDYLYLRKLLEAAMEAEHMQLDWKYDWVPPVPGEIHREIKESDGKVKKVRSQLTREHGNSLSKNMHHLECFIPTPGEWLKEDRRRSMRTPTTPKLIDDMDSEATPICPPHLDASKWRAKLHRLSVSLNTSEIPRSNSQQPFSSPLL